MSLRKVKKETFPCQFDKSGKDLKENLEKTVKRIQDHLKAIEIEYAKKTSKKRFQDALRKDFGHSYYLGKLYAYNYVLGVLGSKLPEEIIKKRGAVLLSKKKATCTEILPYLKKYFEKK